MSEPFLAEIRIFAGNFAPRGWAFCDGQLIQVADNTALFSLLGTTYGGDGRTNFALPDLRGRVPIHPGSGPGLTTYRLGERGGSETTPHRVDSTVNSFDEPHTHELAGGTAGEGVTSTSVATVAHAATLTGQGTDNHQPFLAVNFIIALIGIFPSRN